MLLREGKILLGKRHSDPEKADTEFHLEGTWTMPGGKFERGESFIEGANREVLEETGITLKSARVLCVNNDRNEHAHFVTVGFFSDSFEGEPKVMEPDEIVEWRWFPLTELPTPVYFPSTKIINSYESGRFCVSET